MENLEKLFKAEELHEKKIELLELERRIDVKRQKLEDERKSIEDLKNSVGHLKNQYEKVNLEEKIIEAKENISHNSLCAHLFASKAEKQTLTNKLKQLNAILKKSPYVFMLYSIENKQIIWFSSNMRNVLGYQQADFKDLTLKDIFLQTEGAPEINDGLLLYQPAICANGEKLYVDMHFQPSDETGELALLSFHKVSERYSKKLN